MGNIKDYPWDWESEEEMSPWGWIGILLAIPLICMMNIGERINHWFRT